jgi:pimeloyl-ACP methyl ester carboxylesterase
MMAVTAFIASSAQAGVGHHENERPQPAAAFRFPEVYTDSELETLCALVLLLLGDQETIYDPRRAAERAGQDIPQLRTVIIPDAGHLLNMEQPCVVNREIVSFILDGPGGPSQSAALRPTGK